MRVVILGSRGIPASHGGFETFAERLSLYLVSKGWDVTVYCQDDGGDRSYEEIWNNIRLFHIPVSLSGAPGTIVFDWKSTLNVIKQGGLILTLGYNTAILCSIYRLNGLINLINMDGIEWKRKKYNILEKAWLFINEQLGSLLGNHLIADNPGIKNHLSKRVSTNKITMIPYGSDRITDADFSLLNQYNLSPNKYAIIIARAEPENSILEVVSAFSSKKRNNKLVILGSYEPQKNKYHKRVMELASNEVQFIGAIYNRSLLNALRFYARLYIHGHSVGGTNPALVEALGAGLPVLAHDNPFNRWVAGGGAHYFCNEMDCLHELDDLLTDENEINKMRLASINRHQEEFIWDKILRKYEYLLDQWWKHVH